MKKNTVKKTITLGLIVLVAILALGCGEVDPNQLRDAQGNKIEINMVTLKEVIPTTQYEDQEAILLSKFIALANPQNYNYRIVASDGFSPDPFSYTDMQNGYWLLEEDQTFFPENNIGKTRIRNPVNIIPLVKE